LDRYLHVSEEQADAMAETDRSPTSSALRRSLPTDGTRYDPDVAHCCSIEPKREAAITIQL